MRPDQFCQTIAASLVGIGSLGTALGLARPVEAIQTGGTPPDNALERATVRVGGCSGTLIAPDVVVTAGHCFRHNAPSPPPHEPYSNDSGWGDWEIPARWYPLYDYPSGIAVRIGLNVSRPVFRTTAKQYTIPNNSDVFAIRLDVAVPAEIARPVPVLTRTPADDETLFWSRQSFLRAGYAGGDSLQTGPATQGEYPCPNDGRWRFHDVHKICVHSADGSRTRPGDSGGPLYWTDPKTNVRYLVGVFQGLEDADGDGVSDDGRYTATFHTGVTTSDSVHRGDTQRFFETIVGPSDLAFSWVSGTSAHPTYAHAPTGQPVSVTRTAKGVYSMRLPRPTHHGNVQVTAYGSGSEYCKAAVWTARTVQVRCFNSAGSAADAAFSVLATTRHADLWLWAHSPTSAGYTVVGAYAHSPAPRAPRIQRDGTGVYRVYTWTGGSAHQLRNVQVTAYGTGNERCEALAPGPIFISIVCITPSGELVDSRFALLAATAADRDDDDMFARVSHSVLSAADSRRATEVVRHGVGTYNVHFDPESGIAGGNVQVTSHTWRRSCKVGFWTPSGARVLCFDPSGRAADSAFGIRYLKPR